MKRAIVAFLVGLVTWVVVVSLLNRGLRVGIEGYAAAEPKMIFTLGMQVARLTIAAITSLIAGAVMGWVTRSSTRVPWILGVLLVMAFIPAHVHFWALFPVWYHLTFLVTLAPLIALGSWFARMRTIEGSSSGHPPGVPAQSP